MSLHFSSSLKVMLVVAALAIATGCQHDCAARIEAARKEGERVGEERGYNSGWVVGYGRATVSFFGGTSIFTLGGGLGVLFALFLLGIIVSVSRQPVKILFGHIDKEIKNALEKRFAERQLAEWEKSERWAATLRVKKIVAQFEDYFDQLLVAGATEFEIERIKGDIEIRLFAIQISALSKSVRSAQSLLEARFPS